MLTGILFGSFGFAETNPLSAVVKFESSQVQAGGDVPVKIELALTGDYHAYVDKFKLVVSEPEGATFGALDISPTVEFMDTISKTMKLGVAGSGVIKSVLHLPTGIPLGTQKIGIKLTYQACTTEHCLFPQTLALTSDISIVRDVISATKVAPLTSPKPKSDFEAKLDQGLFSALFFVFFVGFLTSLTPCIYPMIPITLAVLGVKKAGQSRLQRFLLSLFYVIGIAVTYSLMGVAAARTGALFGSALSNIYIVTGIALVFVAMGLSMFGLYELQPPAFIRDRLGSGQSQGFGGAFTTGIIAGVVASPCVGPVLVSVLAWIAKTQSMLYGFVFLFTFAMGMGLLFLGLGLSTSLLSKLPKSGGWMENVKYIFGATMIGMGIYYVAPLYPLWLTHVLIGVALLGLSVLLGVFEASTRKLARVGLIITFVIGVAILAGGTLEKMNFVSLKSAAPVAEQKLRPNWIPYTEAALKAAQAGKKPVIIDFSAEWCAACHELEELTFPAPSVADMTSGFVWLKFDATEPSPELERLQKLYDIQGLPTVVFYDSEGKRRDDLVLTGFEDGRAFAERMKIALDPNCLKVKNRYCAVSPNR